MGRLDAREDEGNKKEEDNDGGGVGIYFIPIPVPWYNVPPPIMPPEAPAVAAITSVALGYADRAEGTDDEEAIVVVVVVVAVADGGGREAAEIVRGNADATEGVADAEKGRA